MLGNIFRYQPVSTHLQFGESYKNVAVACPGISAGLMFRVNKWFSLTDIAIA